MRKSTYQVIILKDEWNYPNTCLKNSEAILEIRNKVC